MATRRSPPTKSPTSPADFSRDSPQSRSKSRGRSTERTRRRGASDSEEPKRRGAGDSEEKKAKRRASSSDCEEKKPKRRASSSDSEEKKVKESSAEPQVTVKRRKSKRQGAETELTGRRKSKRQGAELKVKTRRSPGRRGGLKSHSAAEAQVSQSAEAQVKRSQRKVKSRSEAGGNPLLPRRGRTRPWRFTATSAGIVGPGAVVSSGCNSTSSPVRNVCNMFSTARATPGATRELELPSSGGRTRARQSTATKRKSNPALGCSRKVPRPAISTKKGTPNLRVTRLRNRSVPGWKKPSRRRPRLLKSQNLRTSKPPRWQTTSRQSMNTLPKKTVTAAWK